MQSQDQLQRRKRILLSRPTSINACRTCRTRKIRCDGRRPFCAICERTKRHCGGYSNWELTAPPNGYVVGTGTTSLQPAQNKPLELTPSLSSTSSPNAESSSSAGSKEVAPGGWHKMSLQAILHPGSCPPSVPGQLSRDVETIAARFIELHGDSWGYRSWWIRNTVIRLEGSRELKAATRAVIARLEPQARSRDGIQHWLESIQALRASSMLTEQALLTMHMLAFYELCGKGDQDTLTLHSAAIIAVIHASPEKWVNSEVARGCLYLNHWLMFGLAVRQERSSPFETPIWINMEPPQIGTADAQRLRKITHQNWIRLPRLIAHLRQIKKGDLRDLEDFEKGLSIAEEILDLGKDSEAEISVLQRATVGETIDEYDRRWIPSSYSFDCAQDYNAFSGYCQSRLAILNCYHELIRLGRQADLKIPVIEPNQYGLEQARRVEQALMGRQQSERHFPFLGGRGIRDCMCVWGYLKQQDWRYREQPPELTRKWMMAKAQPTVHWSGFDSEKEMDETSEWVLGGPWLEHLALCRTIPDLGNLGNDR